MFITSLYKCVQRQSVLTYNTFDTNSYHELFKLCVVYENCCRLSLKLLYYLKLYILNV